MFAIILIPTSISPLTGEREEIQKRTENQSKYQEKERQSCQARRRLNGTKNFFHAHCSFEYLLLFEEKLLLRRHPN
jgi:hypothetical protein